MCGAFHYPQDLAFPIADTLEVENAIEKFIPALD